VNDVDLHYELTGDSGPTIVLVHGAWVDSTSWRFLAPILAQTNRVVRYDRRGHSRSGGPGIRHGSREQQEGDLATLIEMLDLGPVHLVGSSYGASIALGLAAGWPHLVRSVVAHEPPLIGAARPGSDLADLLARVATLTELVVADLAGGNHGRGAIRFIEELALGPGSWFTLPEATRRTIVANAPTFLEVVDDPLWGSVPDAMGSSIPILLTVGGASPSWLPAIVETLVEGVYAHATHHTFENAGHAPHLTHHAAFAATITDHIELTLTMTSAR